MTARTKPTYTANLNGHELREASLAALAPPIIHQQTGAYRRSILIFIIVLIPLITEVSSNLMSNKHKQVVARWF